MAIVLLINFPATGSLSIFAIQRPSPDAGPWASARELRCEMNHMVAESFSRKMPG
jgi:hypothetical protein